VVSIRLRGPAACSIAAPRPRPLTLPPAPASPEGKSGLVSLALTGASPGEVRVTSASPAAAEEMPGDTETPGRETPRAAINQSDCHPHVSPYCLQAECYNSLGVRRKVRIGRHLRKGAGQGFRCQQVSRLECRPADGTEPSRAAGSPAPCMAVVSLPSAISAAWVAVATVGRSGSPCTCPKAGTARPNG
jgi:hypothetical protein